MGIQRGLEMKDLHDFKDSVFPHQVFACAYAGCAGKLGSVRSTQLPRVIQAHRLLYHSSLDYLPESDCSTGIWVVKSGTTRRFIILV